MVCDSKAPLIQRRQSKGAKGATDPKAPTQRRQRRPKAPEASKGAGAFGAFAQRRLEPYNAAHVQEGARLAPHVHVFAPVHLVTNPSQRILSNFQSYQEPARA